MIDRNKVLSFPPSDLDSIALTKSSQFAVRRLLYHLRQLSNRSSSCFACHEPRNTP